MNLIFFAHPDFLHHQSMPRFAGMLANGMRHRGYNTEIWSPKARFFKLPLPRSMKKWLGYIDQFLVFPIEVRSWIRSCPQDTIFVITDHALGPWVPLVAHRHHVIHCHDFLAQRSALGEIPENPVRFTGRLYQRFIRRGFSKGKHFISGSEKTRTDLYRFLPSGSLSSDVVYNGLNQVFVLREPNTAKEILSKEFRLDLKSGYLLHVGGNLFYKNRSGVIEIYNAWRSFSSRLLPLLMIGESPSPDLLLTYELSPYKKDIYFLSGVKDEIVRFAYAGATVFLFPSLAEGFGWPIAEAMASRCPVITTNEPPMTEVAGNAAFLIPRRPSNPLRISAWANEAAKTVNKVVELSDSERKSAVEAGLLNAKRFDTKIALDRIEEIYKTILTQL